MNDHSIADDSVIIGHLGDGNLNVVKNNELNTKRPDLSSARPDLSDRPDL